MHYAFLASIITASVLGAAAMSVVHAAEAPAADQKPPPQSAQPKARQSHSAMEMVPVDVSSEPAADHGRQRDSFYGQGFESRGIDVENLPREGPGYGRRPVSH